VRVLTTASRKLTDVAVRWQVLPPGATDAPGQVTVSGVTDHGPVAVVVDIVEGEHR
jgi:hypothetical protein